MHRFGYLLLLASMVRVHGSCPYLIVSDDFNHAIRQMEISSGDVTTLFGNSTAGYVDGNFSAALLNDPIGMALNGTYLFIADSLNHVIRRAFLSTGRVETFVGSHTAGLVDGPGSTARFNAPMGIVLSANRAFAVVTDQQNNAIRLVLTATGLVTTLAGTNVSGFVDGVGTLARFSSPVGIVLASNDEMAYIADRGNNAIRTLNLKTGVVATLSGPSTSIAGFQDGAANLARFRLPYGLALTSDGNILYVSDFNNHAIRKVWTSTGNVTTVAGTHTSGFANGGNFEGSDAAAASSTRFKNPTALAVSPTGDYLIVADSSNNALRRIDITVRQNPSLGGGMALYFNVSTLAGGSAGFVNGKAGAARFNSPRGLILKTCPTPSINPSGLYTPFAYNQLPSAQAAPLCQINNLDWEEIVPREKEQTAWVGGLGHLSTNSTKVWVCLLQNFAEAECPSPPDLACYVWIQPARQFAYWGRNSYLGLLLDRH